MALSHPSPLPKNTHQSPSPSLPHQHPQHLLHMQGQPGQPGPSGSYSNHYAGVRPPPTQAGMNAATMPPQQAAQLQAQQRQVQLAQQQQQLAQHQQTAAQQQQQQRATVPQSPHHPSPSPHLAHQGFPSNGPGNLHPQQYPQPPGPGMANPQQGSAPSPAQMRLPPPHPQQARPPQQQVYQQHTGMQQQSQQQQRQQQQQQMANPQPHPPQPQPGLNGMPGGQHQHAGLEHQDAFAMARAGNGGPPMQQRPDNDGLLRLYIHDYLTKNNLQSTAAQLSAEAGLGDQRVPVNLQEGLLQELWGVFWEVFSGGKGPVSTAVYAESMNRLKTIRQQLGMPVHMMQQAPGGQYPGGQHQPQPISSQQVLNFRQQQAQAQANGLTQAQAQQMQQQMQQQQAQQHALLQQQQAQRFAQPGRSGSPAPRPLPPDHPMYQQQQQHMQLQAPNAQAGPSNSPVAPSPHLMPQAHPGVLPSPHQKTMRPPSMNGPPSNQMMRALTPQQSVMAQQGQQYAHSQQTHSAPSPAGSGPPMTPQQQQMYHAQALQAQAMQQRAQQTLAEAQQLQVQSQHPQQGQQHQQHASLTNQQLQLMQQQQMQATANAMYGSLGLGQVNPTVMQNTAVSLGLGGRDIQGLPEDDRQRLIQRYRLSMQDSQRRAMMAANGSAPTNAQLLLVQQQQQQQQQMLQHQQQQQVLAQQQQRQVQRPNGFDQSTPMQQTDSQNSGRGNSPPDRKRMRRNSGSSAPSPFTGPSQPQQMHYVQPGMSVPQHQVAAMHQQQQQQQQMQYAMAQAQNDSQALRRQESEAKMAYEKKMHQDQTMRSMQLAQSGGVPTPSYQPHTPNMTALDVASPVPNVLTASPRNIVAGRQMQRDPSKGGSMLPPQSPANATQRTSTPKPTTAGRTPKIKEEQLREGATPKSVVPSPNNAIVSIPDTSAHSSSTHGLTPSPPTPADQITSLPQAPTSVPSLSAGSTSLSFATGTDLATDGGFGIDNGGEFDFASLGGLEVNFDFGQYLAELDGEGGDGEMGVVP